MAAAGSAVFDVQEDLQDPTRDHLDRMYDLVKEHRAKLDDMEAEVAKLPTAVPASTRAPIMMATSQAERVPIYDLVEEELEDVNPVARRVLISLTAAAYECEELAQVAEDEFFAPIALFGWNKADDSHSWGAGQLEEMMGRALAKFQEANNFTQRCRDVAVNVLQQLSGLFDATQRSSALWRGAELRAVVSRLGAMLRALLTMDLLVRGNHAISDAWAAFQRAVQTEGAAACGDEGRFRGIRELVLSLDEGLLSGRSFSRCMQQTFDRASGDTGGEVVRVHANKAMNEELTKRAVALAKSAAEACGAGGAGGAAWDDVIGGLCVYALARSVMPPGVRPDTTAFETAWKTQARCPVVPLFHGRAVFLADDFLREFCAIPGLVERRLRPLDPGAGRADAFAAASKTLPADAASAARDTRSWSLRCEMVLAETPVRPDAAPTAPNELMRERGRLLKQALQLAGRCRALALGYLALQRVTEADVLKSCVLALGTLAETLKLVEATLTRHAHVVAVSLPFLVKSSMAQGTKFLADSAQRLSRARAGDATAGLVEVCRTVLSTLFDASDVLSPQRQALMAVAASAFLQRSAYVSPKAAAEMPPIVDEACALSSAQRRAAAATDCSWLYFVRDLAPVMVAAVVPSPVRCQRLPHLLAALTDAADMLADTVHLPSIAARAADGAGGADQQRVLTRKEAEAAEAALARDPRENLVSALDGFLRRLVLETLVLPLCREIEADVRVQVHSVLLRHMSAPSPKDSAARSTGVLPRPAAWLLDLPPLRLIGTEVSVRAEVEAYLEALFFDQTAVALHDWRTYGEMAALASTKYGLAIADHKLPMGSAETATSDLDVLQIMRGVHVFVRRYAYNLHEQVFIERRAEAGAKHLNAVTTDSIRGSVLQHGTGMLNTTVNFAFQFLSRRCFPKLIAFLSDEHVNGILSKRRRDFRRRSKELDGRFPYEDARDMVSAFAKFGAKRTGETCLDQFRALVTQIGNTLGYVRMVRTAGMRQSATAVQFVPSARDDEEGGYERHAREGTSTGAGLREDAPAEGKDGDEEGGEAAGDAAPAPSAGGGEARPLSDETVSAAKCLDDVIQNLMDSFSDETNYLQQLVELFRSSMTKVIDGDGSAAASAGRRRKRSRHPLEQFTTIVPPLTISFVTALKGARAQLERASRGKDAYFNDDGFAVGLAFVLAVLRQERSFDSLHWFESVSEHFAAAEKQLAKDRVRAAAAEKERKARPAAAKAAAASEHDFVLDQHLRDDRPKLTVAETDASIKRQKLTAHTFQGLSFSVFASRIFFRTDDEDLERAARAAQRIRAAAPRPAAAAASASASAGAAADA